MDFEQRLAAVLDKAMFFMQAYAPRDTGNLQDNAIQLNSLGGGKWELLVNQKIAPYMPYTNEPWISDRWNGKKNPNEGWFDRTMDIVIRFIAGQLGGTLRRIS